MSKKNKTSKGKSKTSSETNATDYDEEQEEFRFGTAEFKFENGDQYVGGYGAHINGVVWREGVGKYITKDGQIYEGLWENDVLVENSPLTITFPTGEVYDGTIAKNKFNGPGTYVLDNKLSVVGDFEENKPAGNFLLLDTEGKSWYGTADENDALLFPENIFYDNINNERGLGRPRIKPSKKSEPKTEKKVSLQPEDSKTSEEKALIEYRNWEKRVFAKSAKTPMNLNFEDSAWYSNYNQFKKKYKQIIDKIETEGEESLDDEESEWYEKYLSFKKAFLAILERRNLPRPLSKDNLFEIFKSKEFQKSCPPISVYYPSEKGWEDSRNIGN